VLDVDDDALDELVVGRGSRMPIVGRIVRLLRPTGLILRTNKSSVLCLSLGH
jgi:hypothetical protein